VLIQSALIRRLDCKRPVTGRAKMRRSVTGRNTDPSGRLAGQAGARLEERLEVAQHPGMTASTTVTLGVHPT